MRYMGGFNLKNWLGTLGFLNGIFEIILSHDIVFVFMEINYVSGRESIKIIC